MSRDKNFEAFLKVRLEEDAAIPERCHEAIVRAARAEAFAAGRSSRRLGGVLLAAASLAAVCLMTATGVFSSAPRADAETIACVIDLLRADGDTAGGEASGSVADLLLAWQDEPYLSAISGLVADAATGRE